VISVKLKDSNEATYRDDPFLAAALNASPIKASNLGFALFVWTDDLASQRSRRQHRFHPCELGKVSDEFVTFRDLRTGSTKYPEHIGLTRIGQLAAETPVVLFMEPRRLALVNDVVESLRDLDIGSFGVIARFDILRDTGFANAGFFSGEVESAESSGVPVEEVSEPMEKAEGELDRRTKSSSWGNGLVGELLPDPAGRTPARKAAS
jgi:hypothetical protein